MEYTLFLVILLLNPFFFEGNESIIEEIVLDTTIGKEVIYAFSSNCDFTFKEIEKGIEKIQKNMKGIQANSYDISTDKFYEFIYFNHVK